MTVIRLEILWLAIHIGCCCPFFNRLKHKLHFFIKYSLSAWDAFVSIAPAFIEEVASLVQVS